MREEKLYSTGKAARLLGIHFNTMKKWIYACKVDAIKTLGGQYRIPESEIKRLLGQPVRKNQAICEGVVRRPERRSEAPAGNASGVRERKRVRSGRGLRGHGESYLPNVYTWLGFISFWGNRPHSLPCGRGLLAEVDNFDPLVTHVKASCKNANRDFAGALLPPPWRWLETA